jgi:wyosine [tRNA(Phe)-imidazoG37] synthetase (radical SAM superfamily)
MEQGSRASVIGARICTRATAGSLPVSFLPAEHRVCSFDCTYCTFRRGATRRWPRPGNIEAAVSVALRRRPDVDSIIISGSGDPTLHPRFGMALANVRSAARARPNLRIRVAINGTSLLRRGTRRLLEFADELVVRVDAAGSRVARRGVETPLGAIMMALVQTPLFSVESVFVRGPGGNMDDRSVSEWIGLLRELQPASVYVTTIEGEPADPQLGAASRLALDAIAERARRGAGVPASVVP